MSLVKVFRKIYMAATWSFGERWKEASPVTEATQLKYHGWHTYAEYAPRLDPS